MRIFDSINSNVLYGYLEYLLQLWLGHDGEHMQWWPYPNFNIYIINTTYVTTTHSVKLH